MYYCLFASLTNKFTASVFRMKLSGGRNSANQSPQVRGKREADGTHRRRRAYRPNLFARTRTRRAEEFAPDLSQSSIPLSTRIHIPKIFVGRLYTIYTVRIRNIYTILHYNIIATLTRNRFSEDARTNGQIFLLL